MRIAYLILAHQNIAQLASLIDSLTYNNQNCCFLHLDGRLHSPSVLRQLKNTTNSQSWYAIKKRITINWGGFNMVEATLNLILAALNFSKAKFDYLSLHSGMDFPIKSNKQIIQYLNEHVGHQFIEFFELPSFENWGGNGGLDRVSYYWFIDELGYMESEKLMNAQKLVNAERKIPKKIKTIYGGSQWWTLTADCAEYIIHFLNETPGFYHFFKYANIPDEMFFHTILLNSEYKGQVINNNLRLIDWKINARSPKTFNITDLKKLEQSDRFYARKFDENTDAEIIKHLVQQILI